MERAGVHARWQDPADDGGLQDPRRAELLARAGNCDGSPKAGAMGQFGNLASVVDLPDDATLAGLVREAAALASAAPAPRKPKHTPKPPPELHPEFAAALAANPAAKATLEGFTASARRDYLDWIAEAKQDSTRTKRIATAIDWLTEGKKRHWKYQNC